MAGCSLFKQRLNHRRAPEFLTDENEGSEDGGIRPSLSSLPSVRHSAFGFRHFFNARPFVLIRSCRSQRQRPHRSISILPPSFRDANVATEDERSEEHTSELQSHHD